MTELNEAYWTQRYIDGKTGWDIGYASPQLLEAAANFDRESRILIPGAGNAHEAEALWNDGYLNLYVCDLSEAPLKAFKDRVPDFPDSQLLHCNFFDLTLNFDLILEQTFYCALPPSMRDQYVQQMHARLVQGGTLTGLLFNFPLTEDGPPFGGSQEEYEKRFSPYFKINRLETSELSIPPRAGREFYFEVVKK